MKKVLEYIKTLYCEKVQRFIYQFKEHWIFYCSVGLIGLYLYGMIVASFIWAFHNFMANTDDKMFTLNPIKCLAAVFTPQGLGIAFFVLIMYLLIKQDWLQYITGVKIKKDERNFYTVNEGTHGTSGWMDKKDMKKTFLLGDADTIKGAILGKVASGGMYQYLGLNADNGLNKHIMTYGASGAGKSRGFIKPFILKTAQLKQSMIIVDPKAEMAEQMSEYLKEQGYVVKMFNLLDMENSDGWNCLGEIGGDIDMVQSVAEVIIRNTSEEGQKADFWDKAEKNLLVAMIHYVCTMKDPITGELLPIQKRSLTTIYNMLSTEGQKSFDVKMQALPLDHPARAPYGIFKQAATNLWGNIFIGLGSRLNVFQNNLVKKITSYHEIDLELPGKKPCAYFCIISDQDSSLEFLSSLFFSLLFKKLSDYARKHGDERGRLPVEVNMVLDEFCNVGKLLDFKKTISTVRSRGINCQIVAQSAAQLADRYPVNEWQEIVGNCDTQLMLGCNDQMTSEYISKKCGNITIRTTSSMAPQTPLFSPITRQVNGYKQNTSNATRPLMYPDEIEHMDNRECLIMVRGQKPLKAMKIIPDELSDFHKLKRTRVTEYVPKWRYDEENGISETDNIIYNDKFTDVEDNEGNPFDEFDLTKVEIISSSVRMDTENKEKENCDENIEVADFDPRPLTAQNMIDKFKKGK
ncbi:MAG: type IV secretory system conjugative DNA transfer family protein [Clostridia bacterium]|nr:type IV secretory system conjugative DNA transfer family protein [Clostridia bacterium]MCI8979544.1 type IV secretory system conjugative DNA transfer family protein [Clostridia bacterium]MCI9086761.1 type IV secretory system conjugative DNA transfer family protein [Clostridia bacterium]NDO20269.1 type IV secretory system conjugative DNA transfer family protein [Lachnospiraceae bacterium MD329]